jgi:ABC-type enterochelin transport system substrate-binding protein
MLMDSNRIEELLKRYWNCETSLEEEQQLREYFRGREIPEQLKETAALFQYFEHQKKQELADSAFDHDVLKKVNAPKKGKVVSLAYNAMRIAAGVAVLVTATYLVRNEIRQTTPQEVVDTYDDPKLAFEETKKALMMISKSFGSAEDKAQNLKMFNEAQKQVKKDEGQQSQL